MKRAMKTVLIVLVIFVVCFDWRDSYGNLIFRGLIGRLADALHAAHGGEAHAGRDNRDSEQ